MRHQGKVLFHSVSTGPSSCEVLPVRDAALSGRVRLVLSSLARAIRARRAAIELPRYPLNAN